MRERYPLGSGTELEGTAARMPDPGGRRIVPVAISNLSWGTEHSEREVLRRRNTLYPREETVLDPAA